MNRLELAQEIYDKRKILVKSSFTQGHHVCLHDHMPDGVIFSVWLQGTDSSEAPLFNAELEVVGNNDYPESIDEAKAALKEFLEGNV